MFRRRRRGAIERMELGEALVSRNIVSTEELSTARRVVSQTPGKSLTSALMDAGADEEAVQRAVAEFNHLPFERLDATDDTCDLRSLNKLTPDYCKEHLLMPLRREGQRLVVGTVNPDDVFLLDNVKRQLGVSSIKHVLVTPGDVLALLESQSEAEAEEYDVTEILADVEEDDVEVVKEVEQDGDEDEADSSPVVRYVNHIIQTALKEGASDIHIEAEERSMKVRFRIDGRAVRDDAAAGEDARGDHVSRIKIMANLDIAERRLPQDGRIRDRRCWDEKIDLRVSTVPTPKGEKTGDAYSRQPVDQRVRSTSSGSRPRTLERSAEGSSRSRTGIALVTGPTGSGKTTTLYSSLEVLRSPERNIVHGRGPGRVPARADHADPDVNEQLGITFGRALRSAPPPGPGCDHGR
jgi:type IV pilus assembly protein PilB